MQSTKCQCDYSFTHLHTLQMTEQMKRRNMTMHTAVVVYITGWANSAVKLESTLRVTVTVGTWRHQPFTGIWRQGTRLRMAIVQKTAAVVVEDIWTSLTTDSPGDAHEFMAIWNWSRNYTDVWEQHVLFFIHRVFECIWYKPTTKYNCLVFICKNIVCKTAILKIRGRCSKKSIK